MKIGQEKLALLSAFLFVVLSTVMSPGSSAQIQELRERVVIKSDQTSSQAKQTPPPRVSPTPKISPSVAPSTVTLPLAPVASSPTTRASQTLAELQSNIRRLLQNPALLRGQVGVKIVSLDSGKTIFEENSEKYFMPASNMKSFTVAAALDRLSPDFRFVTSVYAAVQPDAAGTIRGDVIIFGRGDPTFAASFNDGDYLKAINILADKILASGVKRIEGNLIGDESYFSGGSLGATWEWDDLQWYYGAEISALTVNDNSVDLKITPGASVGAPAFVNVLPFSSLFALNNLAVTAPAGTKREIEVSKRLGSNVLEIRGLIPINDPGYSGAIAISKPAEAFLALLKTALHQRGIQITGQTRVVTTKDKIIWTNNSTPPAQQVELVRYESAPLSFVAAKTLKPSQNLYTELILRALGEAVGDKTNPKKTSAERGLEVVQKFLIEAGIAPASVVQFDGSGLSRHNLITPSAAAGLYAFMSRHRYAGTWQAAQTIAGVDGTLKNRFQNTAAAENVRGKTGTIDQVATLSGYIATASGERIAFSVLTNNLPDASSRRQVIDEVVLLLANFNGKSQ